MTVSEIRTKARRILADAVSPYRWSDAELKDHLQDAVRRLHRLAPQTRYVDGLLTDGVTLPEGDTTEFPIDGRFGEALAMYVAYLAYLNDATDTENAERAATCLVRAEGLMVA